MKLATTAQMRELDRIAIEQRGIPSLELMEHAAQAVTGQTLHLLAGKAAPRIVVFCGPGNNGGDGLAAARQLLARGAAVQTVLVGNFARITPDAAANLDRLRAAGGATTPWAAFAMPNECDAVIDALFGVGLARAVGGDFAAAVACMNQSAAPVVACDVPSGIDGDTGRVLGCAVRAACTVTFTCAKPGLLQGEGAQHTGRLVVAPIGIPADLTQQLPTVGAEA